MSYNFYKLGFITTCSKSGLTKEAASGLYKRASLIGRGLAYLGRAIGGTTSVLGKGLGAAGTGAAKAVRHGAAPVVGGINRTILKPIARFAIPGIRHVDSWGRFASRNPLWAMASVAAPVAFLTNSANNMAAEDDDAATNLPTLTPYQKRRLDRMYSNMDYAGLGIAPQDTKGLGFL